MGKHDYAILALLVGCALRRRELVSLTVDDIRMRGNRWVIADLRGQGGRIRTVAVQMWVKQGINVWQTTAGIERSIVEGRGKIAEGLATGRSGPSSPPRRKRSGSSVSVPTTSTALARSSAAKPAGISSKSTSLLGHSSIQTTERYLGCEQEIAIAVNDSSGL